MRGFTWEDNQICAGYMNRAIEIYNRRAQLARNGAEQLAEFKGMEQISANQEQLLRKCLFAAFDEYTETEALCRRK